MRRISQPVPPACKRWPTTRTWWMRRCFVPMTRRAISPEEPVESIHYSYVNNLRWDRWLMAELMKVSGASAGLAVCQLHGNRISRQDQPGIADYEGRLLRLQPDGAVVQRKILWRRNGSLIVADP